MPPKYYLDYFKYLLQFITENSPLLLGQVGETFIQSFDQLSEDAQCLAIRMANRKGVYFRLSKLNYEEITSIGVSADELEQANFASIAPPNDPALFTLYTKSELIKIFPDLVPKDQKKDEILAMLFDESTSEDYQRLLAFDPVIHFQKQEEIEFLKMLFFGHNHGMMTEFVIRDIGNIKLENLKDHQFTPWFDSHEEALAVYELSRLNRLIKDFITLGQPDLLIEALNAIKWEPLIGFANARKSTDRIMLRLGEYFEKTGYLEEAIRYYALAKKHPCRERQIRIYEKLDRTEEAQSLAIFVHENPYNASEKIFAKDFIAKIGKRNLRSTTMRIKSSNEIEVPLAGDLRVESKALEHFRKQGYEGMHTENYLWRSLFGLIFWNELFDGEQASFHHPLQRAPSDLFSVAFYEKRKMSLHQKMDGFRSKKQLINQIKNTHQEKYGINNPLVFWGESQLELLATAVLKIPLAGIKKVMIEIAKNVKDNSAGFPDLFIWNDTDYQFYEVKSPNDHLSSQQLFWLDFFDECKIKSEILRVNYS